MSYYEAITLILKFYPYKDRTWAETQLDRCIANAPSITAPSIEDILTLEFQITN